MVGKFSRKMAERESTFRDGHHRMHDRVAGLYMCEIGEWAVSQSAIQSQETIMTAGGKKETRSAAVTIRLRPSTKALLERQAAEEGRSVTNYLENLIVHNGGKSSQGQ